LFDASALADRHLVVREISEPLCDVPELKTGVQMIDDGILTFTDEEKGEFLSIEPDARQFFKKFLGGDEYINGFHRWTLYLRDAKLDELRHLPQVRKLISRLREYRASSPRASTVRMADYPTRLGVDERLTTPFLVIPNTSSERRDPDVIANQKLRILPKAEPWQFCIVTSQMHMAWMRAITGRLENRYMYSVGIVYNPFPWPQLDDAAKQKLEKLAKTVLDARAAHDGATLADLYDPDVMPEDLRKSHRALDEAVDRLYRKEPFASDRERVEHLFGLYEKLTAPMLAAAKSKRGRKE
jgi:hypothetical protein